MFDPLLFSLIASRPDFAALKDKKDKLYDELLSYDIEFRGMLGKATKNRPLETIYRFVMQYFKTYIGQMSAQAFLFQQGIGRGAPENSDCGRTA